MKRVTHPCEVLRDALEPWWFLQPFHVDAYQQAVEAQYRLPRVGAGTLGILVASTRGLWPAFTRALGDDPGLAGLADPLDTWVMHQLEPAFARAAGGRAWQARFSHEPPPRRVAMQKLALASGLAWLAPSALSVHPEIGPWLALRGVFVVDAPGPQRPAAAPPPCPGCSTGCLPAFERALSQGDIRQTGLGAGWRSWLAVRDACPLGRQHRYSEEQLRYHYTKERRILERYTRER